MSYVPLHLHSNYSLCESTASISDLLDLAEQLGLEQLALTDSLNLYGAIPFYQQARERGLKPILGAQVPVTGGSAILLARDQKGYENLCQLVTRVHLGHGAGQVPDEVSPLDSVRGFEKVGMKERDPQPLAPEELAAHQEGLFILTPFPEVLKGLWNHVETEGLVAEVIRPSPNMNAERELLELSEEREIRIAGTTAAVLRCPEDLRFQRVLAAIRYNRLVTDLDPDWLAREGQTLCPRGEFGQRFDDLPEAVAATREIGDACNLELALGSPIFPNIELRPGVTAVQELRRLAQDGLRWRYRPVTPEAANRLAYEFEIIEKLGFAEYFLVVADIVRFAREQGIPTVGRGSGASSLVSYVLGITSVDPIRFNIHFERFLNLSRSDCPDIDLDFCWQRRDRVIDYVFRKYGAAHTAMISTHNTFRARGAFREVGKACGLSNETLSRLSGKVSLEEGVDPEQMLRNLPQGVDLSPDHLHRMLGHARRLVGFPHHLSVHCGGIVISPGRIDAYTPLERAAKGVIISQFEMNAIEDAGLVKIDLLGNRALSTIDETIQLINRGNEERLSPDQIPESDAYTFEMLREGRTVGVNQLESPAMRNLLRMCRPEKVEDIIAALALVRPGASGAGMKEEYVRRRRSLAPVTYPHPSVIDILRDSLGIMLYEDDTMLVASRLAGLTLDEGDRFRKAVQKARSKERRRELGEWFVRTCRENGVAEDAANALWDQMAKFSSYSFCKSHACGYGQVAFHCAYLKRHFPAAFMVAVMNHHAGMYARAVHIEEAKRLGVHVLLPCVNRSQVGFTLEEGALRVGLGVVKGLSEKNMNHLLSERQARGLFQSLNDFLGRVKLARQEAESLVLCGAFDFTRRIRPELIWELSLTFDTERRQQASDRLFRGNFHSITPPNLNDFDASEKLNHELELLELSAHKHVLAILRPTLSAGHQSDSRHLPNRVGRPIRLLGMLAASRTVQTGPGQKMQFLTLEDEYGLWECTLFAAEYRRYARQVGPWGPYLIEGVVEDQYGATTVRLHRLELLGAATRELSPPKQFSDFSPVF